MPMVVVLLATLLCLKIKKSLVWCSYVFQHRLNCMLIWKSSCLALDSLMTFSAISLPSYHLPTSTGLTLDAFLYTPGTFGLLFHQPPSKPICKRESLSAKSTIFITIYTHLSPYSTRFQCLYRYSTVKKKKHYLFLMVLYWSLFLSVHIHWVLH